MKKTYILLVASLLLGTLASKAQDTLLFNDFQQPHWHAYDTLNSPPGVSTSTTWYLFNANPLANGAASYRPNRWYLSYPVSKNDMYATGMSDTSSTSVITPDTNSVLAASSWTNLGDGANALEANYCISPSTKLGTHDTLFWKSAPFQTPRYVDRYSVLISTSSNDFGVFTDTIFRAAEMVGTPPVNTDTVYADFTFSCYNGNIPAANYFVHGLDGTYIDPAGTTTPISHHGKLHPFSFPLDAYANQTIFVAFLSNSHDDNGITIDDIMIRGNKNTQGVNEYSNEMGLSIYPNPANEVAKVNFKLTAEASVVLNVYDVAGKLIYTENKGTMAQGNHFSYLNISSFAKGFYTVSVQTSIGNSIVKLIVQ
jgi:Secretion system C-terminal sorting domain